MAYTIGPEEDADEVVPEETRGDGSSFILTLPSSAVAPTSELDEDMEVEETPDRVSAADATEVVVEKLF